MKRSYYLLMFGILAFSSIPAQTTPVKFVNVQFGYGTENNYGNTTFSGGVALGKNLNRKIYWQAGVTRITTSVYNANHVNERSFDDEERFYNTWFVTPKMGYRFIGNANSSLKAQ